MTATWTITRLPSQVRVRPPAARSAQLRQERLASEARRLQLARRDHIQVVQQVMALAPEVSGELKASITDGLERKPGWKALEKVKAWLEL